MEVLILLVMLGLSVGVGIRHFDISEVPTIEMFLVSISGGYSVGSLFNLLF